MAARADAALRMDCTGGFKALRKHVKTAKDSGVEANALQPQLALRSEREQEWDESKQLQPLECHMEARDNQERTSQETRSLNVIRLSLAKEQREIKTRERSIKSMETALQDAMERTAEKERSLDLRIQDIACLEQRLHDALTKSSSPRQDVRPEVAQANERDPNLDDTRRKFEEREAKLAMLEQELALARDRAADRERHLSTKERVLRDKATELSQLQTEIEDKETRRATLVDLRLAELARDLQTQHEAKEEELVTRFQQQLACLTAEFEVKRAQLAEQTEAAKAEVRERFSQLAHNEQALQQAEIQIASSQTVVNDQQDKLAAAHAMAAMTGEDAASRMFILDAQKAELADRIEDAHATKCHFEAAEARLKIHETKLTLFAAEVEAQSLCNAEQRQKLEVDRAALDMRMAAAPWSSSPTSMQVAEAVVSEASMDTAPTREAAKPTGSRSFTKGLFRSKPTTNASRES